MATGIVAVPSVETLKAEKNSRKFRSCNNDNGRLAVEPSQEPAEICDIRHPCKQVEGRAKPCNVHTRPAFQPVIGKRRNVGHEKANHQGHPSRAAGWSSTAANGYANTLTAFSESTYGIGINLEDKPQSYFRTHTSGNFDASPEKAT